jgi:hypothetical protein
VKHHNHVAHRPDTPTRGILGPPGPAEHRPTKSMLVKPPSGCCWTRASTSSNLRSDHHPRPPEAVQQRPRPARPALDEPQRGPDLGSANTAACHLTAKQQRHRQPTARCCAVQRTAPPPEPPRPRCTVAEGEGPAPPLQAHRYEQLRRRRHSMGLCPVAYADGGGMGDGGGERRGGPGTSGERRGEGRTEAGRAWRRLRGGGTLVGGELLHYESKGPNTRI